MSPTQRSLVHLRQLGYTAQVVEKWNPFARVRQDFFGGDLIGFKPGSTVLVVQATSVSNHAARRTKMEAAGFIELWKGAGAALEIWSWKQAGSRAARKVWWLRRETL